MSCQFRLLFNFYVHVYKTKSEIYNVFLLMRFFFSRVLFSSDIEAVSDSESQSVTASRSEDSQGEVEDSDAKTRTADLLQLV